MRVLIIEQASDFGHHLNSVRHLVDAFGRLGCEIVIAVPDTVPEISAVQDLPLGASIAFSAGIYSSSRRDDEQMEDDSDPGACCSRID